MARGGTYSKRMLSLIFAVILLLVSIYLFGALVRPAFGEVRGLLGELAAQKRFLESQRNAKQLFDSLKADYQDAANIQGLLATALPEGADLPNSIHQIQALAGVSGVSISSMSAEADVGGGVLKPVRSSESLIEDVKTMRVDFQAVGSYESLKKFLTGIEGNIKLMDVVDLRVVAAPGGNVYDFTVNLYYQE